MNIRLFAVTALCSLIIGTMPDCSSKKNKNTQGNKQPVVNAQDDSTLAVIDSIKNTPPQKGVVCISDGLVLREAPIKNGKLVSTINLGETVISLDSATKDLSDKSREYFKIRLSDGKVGWALSSGLKKDVIPAVFKTNASLYMRPDHLTITETRFIPMEFIIITNTQDDWIEVFGDRGKKIGWAKKDAATTSKEDITTAILISKKMNTPDTISMINKLRSLISDAPYPSSIFIQTLRQRVTAESLAISQKIELDSATQTLSPVVPEGTSDTVSF